VFALYERFFTSEAVIEPEGATSSVVDEGQLSQTSLSYQLSENSDSNEPLSEDSKVTMVQLMI
jgi:hypothetical protein